MLESLKNMTTKTKIHEKWIAQTLGQFFFLILNRKVINKSLKRNFKKYFEINKN